MAHMAAADGALRRLFEKPLPENPTLLEVLSACSNHIHHKKPVDPASITEIFGELHFQEKPDIAAAAAVAAAARVFLPPSTTTTTTPAAAVVPPSTASWLDVADAEKSKDDSSLDALLKPKPASAAATVKRSASFCMKRSASLLLCTEGLGSESTVDADDMVKDGDADALRGEESMEVERSSSDDAATTEQQEDKEEEQRRPAFPPPIRSIGRGGRPCVCFRSFRAEGRFVLVQVVIPGKELLHASREGGRLRLQFANAAAAAAAAGIDGELAELGEDEDDHEEAKNNRCVVAES